MCSLFLHNVIPKQCSKINLLLIDLFCHVWWKSVLEHNLFFQWAIVWHIVNNPSNYSYLSLWIGSLSKHILIQFKRQYAYLFTLFIDEKTIRYEYWPWHLEYPVIYYLHHFHLSLFKIGSFAFVCLSECHIFPNLHNGAKWIRIFTKLAV